MSHDQPTYANLPGIRVFGMKCVAPSSAAGVPQRKKPVIHPHRIPPPKQGQSNYHYLHRPDSVVHASELPQHIQHHGSGSLGSLTNGYGRSTDDDEEEQGAETTTAEWIAETTASMGEDQVRQKKSMQFADGTDNEQNGAASDDEPEFPWHRVMELQDALRWNANN